MFYESAFDPNDIMGWKTDHIYGSETMFGKDFVYPKMINKYVVA